MSAFVCVCVCVCRLVYIYIYVCVKKKITRLLQAINGKTYFPLLLIAATTTPLQGKVRKYIYIIKCAKHLKKKETTREKEMD